jgi:hypothetical protein
MKRVFTDDRFPGIEIHNDGSKRFQVLETIGGVLTEVDSFVTYQADAEQEITEVEAEHRAKSYFTDLCEDSIPKDRDHTDIFNNDAFPPTQEVRASLDDLMGGRVLTAEDVIAQFEKAAAIADPSEREKAIAQVRQSAARLESSASELVQRLLD